MQERRKETPRDRPRLEEVREPGSERKRRRAREHIRAAPRQFGRFSVGRIHLYRRKHGDCRICPHRRDERSEAGSREFRIRIRNQRILYALFRRIADAEIIARAVAAVSLCREHSDFSARNRPKRRKAPVRRGIVDHDDTVQRRIVPDAPYLCERGLAVIVIDHYGRCALSHTFPASRIFRLLSSALFFT